MSRPRVLRLLSSSRSATPSHGSSRKALPSFWSNRISALPRRWRTASTSSSTARSSTVSRTRSCKPIWTSFTPISASETNANIKQGAQYEKQDSFFVVAGHRADLRGWKPGARAGQDRENRRPHRQFGTLLRPWRRGLYPGGSDGDRGFRTFSQGLEDRFDFRRPSEQAGHCHHHRAP